MHKPAAILLALLIAASAALAQAPSNLTVKSATSTQTQLAWSGSASSYTVQRALIGGAFANIATVTTTSYTDTTLDPYNQTLYQVVAGTSGNQASNPVTVGPPPSGLSLVAPAPLIGNVVATSYGAEVTMALDGNGDPAFAFLFLDPLNNNDPNTAQLLFRSWNRAAAQWNPIVKVETPGNITSNGENVIALAYDKTTSTFVIAAQNLQQTVDIFVSANSGATWTLKTTLAGKYGLDGPGLALNAGNIYLAFQDGGDAGLVYYTGKLSADPSTWTKLSQPTLANAGLAYSGTAPSVALDPNGAPAVAYWASDPANGYNEVLVYWRPAGSAPPVKVTDTKGVASGELGVRMVFQGANPRIGFAGNRDNSAANIYYVASNDGGNTWQTPIQMPTDGNSSTDYPLDLAIAPSGIGAMIFNAIGALGDGSEKCGVPKLSTSSDLKTWTTCQVAPDLGAFVGQAGAVAMVYGGNSKRIALFQSQGDATTNSGVVMYREPPDNQPTGPVISAVQDAESSLTTVVPGEWIAIYGANLAGTTRTWTGTDFNGSTLPTSLSGVSVQFNGLPAAVFYISPTQIDVQAPAGISGTVPVTVTNSGSVGAGLNVNVVSNAPSLFYYPAGTNLFPAAIHLDGTLIGDPAITAGTKKVAAGETIVLFVNGLASSPAGTIVSAPIAYSGSVTVTFGAKTATPAFVGLVAAGEYQINVAVPAGLASGTYPLSVTVAGQTSTASVMIPVQ